MDIYEFAENQETEYKEASNGLPRYLCETYSAFANSNGGAIILGVKEKNNEFEVKGLNNIDKIIKDLWDNLNNPKKVSSNIISDSNVIVENYEGKDI